MAVAIATGHCLQDTRWFPRHCDDRRRRKHGDLAGLRPCVRLHTPVNAPFHEHTLARSANWIRPESPSPRPGSSGCQNATTPDDLPGPGRQCRLRPCMCLHCEVAPVHVVTTFPWINVCLALMVCRARTGRSPRDIPASIPLAHHCNHRENGNLEAGVGHCFGHRLGRHHIDQPRMCLRGARIGFAGRAHPGAAGQPT